MKKSAFFLITFLFSMQLFSSDSLTPEPERTSSRDSGVHSPGADSNYFDEDPFPFVFTEKKNNEDQSVVIVSNKSNPGVECSFYPGELKYTDINVDTLVKILVLKVPLAGREKDYYMRTVTFNSSGKVHSDVIINPTKAIKSKGDGTCVLGVEWEQ